MRALVALAVLGLVGFGLVATGMVQLPEIGSIARLVQPAPSIALPGVDLKSLSSQYGFLQGDFDISNTNAFPIAHAAIHCDAHGPNGAVIHSFDFVVDEAVPPNGKTAIRNYKFGFWPQESSQMRCRATSVERN